MDLQQPWTHTAWGCPLCGTDWRCVYAPETTHGSPTLYGLFLAQRENRGE